LKRETGRKKLKVNTFDKIYNVVGKIPKGKVLTYKKVAEISGVKNPRVVGFALHVNKNPDEIPCHRVVKANGRIANGYAFGGKKTQIEKLKREDVYFLDHGTVDLNKSLHEAPNLILI
jgi:methylated-DNA-protein-cysteine methyltransferase-like protein